MKRLEEGERPWLPLFFQYNNDEVFGQLWEKVFRQAVNDRPNRCSIVDLLPVLNSILRELSSNEVKIQKYSRQELLLKMGPNRNVDPKSMMPVTNEKYDMNFDLPNTDSYEVNAYEVNTYEINSSSYETEDTSYKGSIQNLQSDRNF